MFTKPTKTEIEKLSQMSYKELFILKGLESALRSLMLVVVWFVLMRYVFHSSIHPIVLSILFLFDASINTFKYKWFVKK